MGGKTLTRADLAEGVYRKVGLSRTESAELVEAGLDEICEAIVRGETVKLSSLRRFTSAPRTSAHAIPDRRGSADPAAPGDDLQVVDVLRPHPARSPEQQGQGRSGRMSPKKCGAVLGQRHE
jgi:integration host factor subunit alpha